MKRFFAHIFSILTLCFLLGNNGILHGRPTQFSLTLNRGQANLTETYLSPYRYKGGSWMLSGERIRRYKNKEHLLGMQNLNIEFSNTEYSSHLLSTRYEMQVDYAYTFFAPCFQGERLKIYAGGGGTMLLGVVYNTRNGNNPANAKWATELQCNALLSYSIPIKKKEILLRYVLSLPFIGVFFMPEFGGSYYEMYDIGNRKNTIHFSFWHNRQGVRNLLTADYPLGNGWLRIGVLSYFSRMHQNNLVSSSWTNYFLLGYVVECNLSSPKKGSIISSKTF